MTKIPYLKTGFKPHPDSARAGWKYSPKMQPYYIGNTSNLDSNHY